MYNCLPTSKFVLCCGLRINNFVSADFWHIDVMDFSITVSNINTVVFPCLEASESQRDCSSSKICTCNITRRSTNALSDGRVVWWLGFRLRHRLRRCGTTELSSFHGTEILTKPYTAGTLNSGADLPLI